MSAFQDGPEEVAFMSYKDHWHKEYKGIYVSACVCVCVFFLPFFRALKLKWAWLTHRPPWIFFAKPLNFAIHVQQFFRAC